MYQIVMPLAVSLHTPTVCGALHCFSLHNKAINLLNQNSEMITLHRYNMHSSSGLSPMGWLLRSDDFDYLYDRIAQGSPMQQQPNGDLMIGDLHLLHHSRQLSLTMKRHARLQLAVVKEILKPIRAMTGLFGPLGDNITTDLPVALTEYIQTMLTILKQPPLMENLAPKHGVNPQLLALNIGLGPGLTPSYDDMLVGTLSVLYCDDDINAHLLADAFLVPMAELERLTTKVSATFLHYAIQGIFTSPLLAVIYAFRQYKSSGVAVTKLLNYGHTSGADLLLGIWLGTLILQAFHGDKGYENVRS
ncbi:DUF2877 domain-containing protein [Orbaceae bacterium ESL0727]|nr:DUF2877 domain-containing protein [Orbaceae bacterium ESL0727]